MNKSGGILLTLIGFVFLLVRCSNADTPIENVGDQAWLNLHDTVKYVGMETCRSCHNDKFETFVETGMGMSFGKAEKERSSGVFHSLHPVFDKHSNLYYLPFWQNDSMFVREFRINDKKDTVHNRVEYIQYIIGSGQHTNSHLININGYVYQAPITFYTQKKIWDLPPGFENGNNSRFLRLINEECMSCHNALPGFDFQSDNKFTQVPHGIDCERCHGPGELHVQEKLKGNRVDTKKMADYTIVNPSRLSWELQVDVCQRCHLQGNAVLEPGKSFLDFRPGMRLNTIMSIFMPQYEGDEPGFIMASHSQRLQQSYCFIESTKKNAGNELTCITCHNPHVSVRKTGNQVFNTACQNCHQEKKCTEKKEVLEAKNHDCVLCHMPSNSTLDIPHVTVHDHNIRKPVKSIQNQSEKKVVGLYAVNNPNPSKQMRIKAYLSQYEKFERDNTLWLDSAENLLISEGRANVDEWIRLMYLKSDFQAIVQISSHYKGKEAWTWYRIARAMLLENKFPEALVAIKKAVDLKPKSLDFLNEYAVILIQNNAKQEALEVLNNLLALQPKQARTLVNRGFLYEMEGKYNQSIADYQKALALDPDNQQAQINLKRVLSMTK